MAQCVQGIWKRLDASDCERFTLVWETKELIQLNINLKQFAIAFVRPCALLPAKSAACCC